MAYDFRRTCQKSGADNERLMRNKRLGQRRNTAEAKRSGHGDGIGGRCKGGYRWGKCRYNKIRPTLDRGSANSRRDRSKTNARGCQGRGLSIEFAKRQRRTRNAPKRGYGGSEVTCRKPDTFLLAATFAASFTASLILLRLLLRV